MRKTLWNVLIGDLRLVSNGDTMLLMTNIGIIPVVQGNQQSMHFAFLFNWAKKPWLTQNGHVQLWIDIMVMV